MFRTALDWFLNLRRVWQVALGTAVLLFVILLSGPISALAFLVLLAALVMLAVRVVRRKEGAPKFWGIVAGSAFATMIVLGMVSGAFTGTSLREGVSSPPPQQAEAPEEPEPEPAPESESPEERTPEEIEEVAGEEAAEEMPDPEPEPEPATLGMTTDELQSQWNSEIADLDTPELEMPPLQVEIGEAQDVFQHSFTGEVIMLGSARQASGEVRDVSIIGSPTTELSSAQLLLSWGVLISTLSPELSPDERGDVMRELGILDDDVDFTSLEAQVVRGDVRYSIISSEFVGITLSGAPVE